LFGTAIDHFGICLPLPWNAVGTEVGIAENGSLAWSYPAVCAYVPIFSLLSMGKEKIRKKAYAQSVCAHKVFRVLRHGIRNRKEMA